MSKYRPDIPPYMEGQEVHEINDGSIVSIDERGMVHAYWEDNKWEPVDDPFSWIGMDD